MMSDEVRAALAERMNRLPLVRWDRCVEHDVTAATFGWIERPDGRSDFVLLDFSWGDTVGLAGETLTWLAVGFSTSSARHSDEMSAQLELGEGHKDCERIEDVFGDAVRQRVLSR